MSYNRKMSRVAQTKGEYRRVQIRVLGWFSERIDKPELAQYDTQLKVLNTWFEEQIKKLSSQVEHLSAGNSVAAVYQSCQDYEQYLLWVQRVWEYYRSRFDQRFVDGYADILAAADEVVWSCFGEVFEEPPPGIEARKRPAPMPFFEPGFSPVAYYRTPPELQSPDMSPAMQEKLAAYLRSLPVPLISLPAWCLQAPWWLVLLAHEVGHHVERESGVALKFRNLLIDSVGGGNGNPDPVARWKLWSNEIFADMFSVYMVGSPAYWAIAELETTDDQLMVADRPQYPSPIIRMALMAALCNDVLNFNEPAPVAFSDPNNLFNQVPANDRHKHFQELAHQDYQLVKPLIEKLDEEPLIGFYTLKEISSYNPNLVAKADGWADALGAENPGVEKTRQAARQIISGAIKAWMKINTSGGEQEADEVDREGQRQALGEKLIATLKASKEPGTRSGPPESDLEKQLPEIGLFELFTQPDVEVPVNP